MCWHDTYELIYWLIVTTWFCFDWISYQRNFGNTHWDRLLCLPSWYELNMLTMFDVLFSKKKQWSMSLWPRYQMPNIFLSSFDWILDIVYTWFKNFVHIHLKHLKRIQTVNLVEYKYMSWFVSFQCLKFINRDYKEHT